jgi:DHA1 family bicyclomycin/chloramphenicol resistance-like MFS transporter
MRTGSISTIALLMGLMTIAPLSIDMFLPSLPMMIDEFNVSASTMQLTVTTFLLAFSASQLVFGPLSDRFGRRPIMIWGLILFLFGGFVSLFAQSGTMLIIGRIIQGFGGGAAPVIARAIVLDVFEGKRAAKIFAYITIATPLAPAIAPIIGGVLQSLFDWHAVFITLIAIGIILLGLYLLLLPETNKNIDRLALNSNVLIKNYTRLGTHRINVLLMGLMFSAQLVFISGSSFVLIDELGLSPLHFGFSFAFVAIGIMGGAYLSSRMMDKYTSINIVGVGILTATIGSCCMFFFALSGITHVFVVVLPMFFISAGFGVSRPPVMASAMLPFREIAGMASAGLGFLQMLIASVYNIVFSSFFSIDQITLSVGILLSVLVAFIVFTFEFLMHRKLYEL